MYCEACKYNCVSENIFENKSKSNIVIFLYYSNLNYLACEESVL